MAENCLQSCPVIRQAKEHEMLEVAYLAEGSALRTSKEQRHDRAIAYMSSTCLNGPKAIEMTLEYQLPFPNIRRMVGCKVAITKTTIDYVCSHDLEMASSWDVTTEKQANYY